ncbi:MAG: AAA family ATPase [Magnetococcales bacterium]|nr:AAA family ATPase [Magnetococcales bacterium]
MSDPFLDALENTAPFAETGGHEASVPALADLLVDLAAANEDNELSFVVEGVLPRGEVCLLSGHGGAGKSYVSLLLAIHVALGRDFGGLRVAPPARVLFFSSEDPSKVLRKRARRIFSNLGVDPAELAGRLHLLDASGLDPALHRADRQQSMGTPLLDELQKLVERLGVGLIIIDGASDAFDGDEIRRAHVRAFLRDMRTKLARPDRAVLLLAHVSKSAAVNPRAAGGQDFSGSTAWHNSVRSRLSLRPDGQDGLILEQQKSNYGAIAKPIRLRWVDGCPVVIPPETSANQGGDAEEIKVALCVVVADFDRRGERIPVAVTGSSTAYKTMLSHQWFPADLDSNGFARLMRELETEGRIFRKSVRKPDRKMVEVFTTLPPEGARMSVGREAGDG